MHDLLSMGRFSEVTGLTVKELRLYDKLGLLRPAMVDLASGVSLLQPRSGERRGARSATRLGAHVADRDRKPPVKR